MNVTEYLVTAYDGDAPIYGVNLTADSAATVFTGDDNGHEATIDGSSRQTTSAFVRVHEALQGITLVAH